MPASDLLIWLIALASVACVMLRPRGWPEAVWAMLGAGALVAAGLLPIADAVRAVANGWDVYLFLIGMMFLSEVARQEGLFDHMAASAARFAKGSAMRLFALVYGVGVLVTVFLSNDATAVVLTPAVYAAARAAGAAPQPYLFACAFIANAASFVLPISNPANLVVFGGRPPALMDWIALFGPASAASIVVTFAALRLVFGKDLRGRLDTPAPPPPLSRGCRVAAFGLAGAVVVLLAASAFDVPLGLPTLVAGLATAAAMLLAEGKGPVALARGISWSVLPLVAGLFIIVEALARTGAIEALAAQLGEAARAYGDAPTSLAAGAITAFAVNLMNNLPAGLIAAKTLAATQPAASPLISGAVMIGVDLGPNLSVTGSLATILWLLALRREGLRVGALRFLGVGALVMTPALVASLAALVWFR